MGESDGGKTSDRAAAAWPGDPFIVTDIANVNVIVIQVTLVFTRSEQLNNKLNPDTDLVGVRIPDHDFLREV